MNKHTTTTKLLERHRHRTAVDEAAEAADEAAEAEDAAAEETETEETEAQQERRYSRETPMV